MTSKAQLSGRSWAVRGCSTVANDDHQEHAHITPEQQKASSPRSLTTPRARRLVIAYCHELPWTGFQLSLPLPHSAHEALHRSDSARTSVQKRSRVERLLPSAWGRWGSPGAEAPPTDVQTSTTGLALETVAVARRQGSISFVMEDPALLLRLVVPGQFVRGTTGNTGDHCSDLREGNAARPQVRRSNLACSPQPPKLRCAVSQASELGSI